MPTREYAYVVRCAEHQGRQEYQPWSIRQYGLYHSYDRFRGQSVWVLVSPLPGSKVEKRALQCLSDLARLQVRREMPFWLDALLFATSVGDWHAYMTNYERQIEAVVRRVHLQRLVRRADDGSRAPT